MANEKTWNEVHQGTCVAALLTHARMGTQVNSECAESAIREVIDHFESPKSAGYAQAPGSTAQSPPLAGYPPGVRAPAVTHAAPRMDAPLPAGAQAPANQPRPPAPNFTPAPPAGTQAAADPRPDPFPHR